MPILFCLDLPIKKASRIYGTLLSIQIILVPVSVIIMSTAMVVISGAAVVITAPVVLVFLIVAVTDSGLSFTTFKPGIFSAYSRLIAPWILLINYHLITGI